MALVALCWSLTPTLDTLAINSASPSVHALLVVVALAAGLLVMATVQGRVSEVSEFMRDRRAMLLMLAAVVFAAVASGLQLMAYQRVDVGLVETVKRGLGATMAMILGRLIFKEHLGAARIVAVVFMIAGVMLVIMT